MKSILNIKIITCFFFLTAWLNVRGQNYNVHSSSLSVSIKPFIKSKQAQNITQKNDESVDITQFLLNTVELSKVTESIEELKLEIPITTDSSIVLQLSKTDLHTQTFSVTDEKGNNLIIQGTGSFFRGVIDDQSNSHVAVSIFPNTINVLIESEKGAFEIKKDPKNEFYNYSNLKASEVLECSSISEKENELYEISNATTGCKVLSINVTVSFNLFVLFEGSTYRVYQKISTLVNEMNLPYQMVGVGLRVNNIVIFTSAAESFNYSNNETLIASYNAWYFSTPRAGHLGIFLTNWSYGTTAGTAYIANICNQSSARTGWARVNNSNVDYLVVAHEIGHILGQNHVTSATIMNASLSSNRNTFDPINGNGFLIKQNQCGVINNDKPVLIGTERIYGTSATLKWNRAASSTSYTVYYKDFEDSVYISIPVGNVTSLYLWGLKNGKAYQWYVLGDCSEPDPDPNYELFFTQAIYPSHLTDRRVCRENGFEVSFITYGEFNSTNNYFTVQLSDPTGSFFPNYIGTLVSDYGGIINATIPSSVAVGSGYKIRVVGSDPYIISDTLPISIEAVCPPKCPDSLVLVSSKDDLSSRSYNEVAKNTISASNKIEGSKSKVWYSAGKSILLEPGFEVKSGMVFTTEMAGCN